MSAENQDKIVREFQEAVNMTPSQIEAWLKTPDSKEVGQKASEGSESTGHQSGRNIVALLQKHKADYTDEDVHQMQRVVSYVHRHLAQKPAGEIEHTHWRYSLMNWGHDPLKQAAHKGA
jgi:hypothetical protein